MTVANRRYPANSPEVHALFEELRAQGRSRVWLAARLGVDKRRVWTYEHGRVSVPSWFVAQTREALGMAQLQEREDDGDDGRNS